LMMPVFLNGRACAVSVTYCSCNEQHHSCMQHVYIAMAGFAAKTCNAEGVTLW